MLWDMMRNKLWGREGEREKDASKSGGGKSRNEEKEKEEGQMGTEKNCN